jgi:hypothetical protein
VPDDTPAGIETVIAAAARPMMAPMRNPVRTAALLWLAALLLLVPVPACDDGDDPDDGGADDGGETPETSCCDLDERPGEGGTLPCIEGASCCQDGTWSCNEGDGSPTCDPYGGVCQAATAMSPTGSGSLGVDSLAFQTGAQPLQRAVLDLADALAR